MYFVFAACGIAKADIVFVADQSHSIREKNWQKLRLFMVKIVDGGLWFLLLYLGLYTYLSTSTYEIQWRLSLLSGLSKETKFNYLSIHTPQKPVLFQNINIRNCGIVILVWSDTHYSETIVSWFGCLRLFTRQSNIGFYLIKVFTCNNNKS